MQLWIKVKLHGVVGNWPYSKRLPQKELMNIKD